MQRTRLFTDADNTLWDTNSVFAAAQVGLLRDIESEVRLTAPEASDEGLAFVRRIDQEGLADLRRSAVPVTVLTEASLGRCAALIEAHGLSRFISGIRSVRKDAGAYRALREHADEVRLVMVGDQLDRDVNAAKRAGFLTIFFPGGFVPSWNGCSSVTADHEIQRYDEIPPLLHR